MADFAAPAPEDDQQPAASAAVSSDVTAEDAPAAQAAEPDPVAVAEVTIAAESLAVETVVPTADSVAVAPEAEAPSALEAPPTTPAVTEVEFTPAQTDAVVPVEPLVPVEQPPALNSATAATAPAPVEPAAPAAEPASPAPTTLSITPPAIDAPSIASTIEVPASAPAEAGGEGGEWELLVQKVSTWVRSGQLQQQWQTARTPLSLLAGLIALLLVLRVYNALLAVIDGLPLLPGLLELVGVIAVVRFSLTRLVRSEERQQLLQGLQQRWNAFRGQG